MKINVESDLEIITRIQIYQWKYHSVVTDYPDQVEGQGVNSTDWL